MGQEKAPTSTGPPRAPGKRAATPRHCSMEHDSSGAPSAARMNRFSMPHT
jgi:hypothetical protein